jgi:hypothetical protein
MDGPLLGRLIGAEFIELSPQAANLWDTIQSQQLAKLTWRMTAQLLSPFKQAVGQQQWHSA